VATAHRADSEKPQILAYIYAYDLRVGYGCRDRGGSVPVGGDIEVEVADVRRVLGDDDVAGELARGEPEGEVWHFVQLELCMHPVHRGGQKA